MVHRDCLEVQSWVRQAILSLYPTQPEPRLYMHIATCPLCRGAMAALVVESLDLAAAPTTIGCDACAIDLPTFIEYEVEVGSSAAIRAYPHVWWHLWTCEDCADTYQISRPLIEEQQAASAKAVKRESRGEQRVQKRQSVIRLKRSFLSQALVPAGATRSGSQRPAHVLIDKEMPNQALMVSVQQQVDGDWRIDVSIKPVPAGHLLLKLGSAQFHASFDTQGTATILNMPDALLNAIDGPNLEIEVETDQEPLLPHEAADSDTKDG